MRKLSTLFLSALLCTFNSFSQISFTGNSSTITTPVNSPAIVVDDMLTITSGVSFDGAKVSVSSNFNSGDVLAFTGALPSGVSGSYNSTTGVLTFTGIATPADYQTLLRTVTFATSSTVALQRTVLFNLGAEFAYASNGHLYEFVSPTVTWSAAKADAAARSKFGMQGYLSTITSSGENDFITLKLAANGWIGASDDYTQINGGATYANQGLSEGKWHWVTGPESGTQFSTGSTVFGGQYSNWNGSEPNNSGGNEHYAQIFASVNTGKWNDLGTQTMGYVVEYGGMGGDPSVDIIHTRNITLIATSLRATGTTIVYKLLAPSITVDNAFLLYSSANNTNARVTISNGFRSGDVLSYTGVLPGGVTAAYNSSTGVQSFTGTATPAAWQALLRTVQFNSTSTTVNNRTISFSVGNLISGSNGHFYEYVATTGDWSAARTGANARTYLGLQGYVATITTQEENDFIQQKLSADAWIGLSDQWNFINPVAGTSYVSPNSSEGNWYWITGPEAGQQITTGNAPAGSYPPVFGSAYNNWNLGEPNNSTDEHFGQIYSTGGTPGKWNDRTGASLLPYVVEYGGLSTDPLLELSASRTIVITSVLPVNGLMFNAVKKNETVMLSWSTESEEKTSRFEVMHSVDGRNFTKIGTVAAAQNSTVRTSYSFIHTTVNAGTNYYRLSVIDIDERSTWSEVKQVTVKGKLSISPNPAVHEFTISNPFAGAATIIVRNAAGALVIKKTLNQLQTLIDINTLSPGVYFVEVTQGNNVSETMKLIKK